MKTFNSVEKWTATSPVRFDRRASKFVVEWQEHGPETLSGLAVRKLRLSFAPSQLVAAASTAG